MEELYSQTSHYMIKIIRVFLPLWQKIFEALSEKKNPSTQMNNVCKDLGL